MRDSEFVEKLVAINRITKVVKGGRRFGFAALVVVGNQKGSIGLGKGKSKFLGGEPHFSKEKPILKRLT